MSEEEMFGHEIKFPLPATALPAARLLLRAHAEPEAPHPAGTVESIYFDTPALDAYQEKRSGDYFKTKFRLRWYDGGGSVFAESKRRLGSRRAKRRVAIGLDGAELGRSGLDGARAVGLAALACALAEPVAGDLVPVLHLSYRRERFVTRDGQRLNLDSEIEVVATADWLGGRRRAPQAGDRAVLETKGASRDLPLALAALSMLGCRRGSFSKYAAGLESCGI